MKKLALKIGGSLLYNDDLRLNELFLSKFKEWYEKYSKGFEKLAIAVGGGKLSRQVGNNLKGIVVGNDLHGVAMQITQVNAEIVKGYLKDGEIYIPQTLREAILELDRPENVRLISGGLKEGWSTDMDAAAFADAIGVNKVYKLSNVEGVYTSDPRKDKNAKLIEDISWDEFFEKFNISTNDTHQPNVNTPISVETAIFCRKKEITFYVAGGKNIYEIDKLEKVFESGTKIHP